MGGIRAGAPKGAIRPYGVFGAGVAHLSGSFEYRGRNITSLVEDEIGGSLTSNELAFELGAGVMIPAGSSAFVDAGYRYTRINGADINVSRVYGGIGVRF
jgi:opacity protein-like surface antigen